MLTYNGKRDKKQLRVCFSDVFGTYYYIVINIWNVWNDYNCSND